MPKKIGTNSKALEARERKQATKKATQEKSAKEAEDKMWKDDADKSLVKKQQRREEEERKRVEAARRKAEAKELLDREMSEIKTQTQGKQPLAKVHRQLIIEEMEKKQRALDAANTTKQPTTRIVVPEPAIEENLNRALADTAVATSVDQALAVLSVKDDDDDKHPEKRMRSAYKAFEAANMPRIKAENPSQRLSQWKQILMKEWNKSPDNPFNQAR